MRVLVVNNMAPFVSGGAEELANHLERNILAAGHEAEVIRIPFQWEPAVQIPTQMLLARTIELRNVDHVIALKFPAYLVRHPKKTLWLLHQYRQAYDLWDVGQSNMPEGKQGEDLKDLIRCADNQTFSECRKIFTNSSVTKQRLQKYNGFNAEVLLPPVNDPEIFDASNHGDYIFAGGRINNAKRQILLVKALAKADRHVKLIIGGPPDSIADAEAIKSAVEVLGLSDRVVLDLRFLPRRTYADYLNRSLAVAYIPFDEDSLGYVAMEGATARKALISTSDAGGILGLAIHQKTGWVCNPSVDELAMTLNAVYQNRERTIQYGQQANEVMKAMGISWPETIAKLLG